MPFSATQTRGLLLRGSGGSKRSVITPYQQGVSGRSVLTPWRQDGPFATASRVAPFWQEGPASRSAVAPFYQSGTMRLDAETPFSMLDANTGVDEWGGIVAPLMGWGDPSPAPALGFRELVWGSPDVLGYWRLGEASGSAAADALGITPGTYSGTHTKGATGALTSDPDTSVTFAATGQVDVTDLFDLFDFVGTAPYSLMALMYATTVDGTSRSVVSRDWSDGSGRQGWNLSFSSSGMSWERWRDNLADYINVTTGMYAWAANRVHVLIGTYDGAAMRLYMDGVLRGTSGSATRSQKASTANLRIANKADATAGANQFLGRLDEVALFSRALSPEEVTSFMAAARPG